MTIEQALRDPAREVVEAALEALDRFRFPDAVDPLVRIYQSTVSPAARIRVIRALARFDVPQSIDLVLSVLDVGPERRPECGHRFSEALG